LEFTDQGLLAAITGAIHESNISSQAVANASLALGQANQIHYAASLRLQIMQAELESRRSARAHDKMVASRISADKEFALHLKYLAKQQALYAAGAAEQSDDDGSEE